MTKQFVLILTYHQDPEHGWIEVPAELIDRLGILNDISGYSYYSHDRQVYYLEEDADASLLIKTLKFNGYEYVLRDKMYDGRAPCTRCSRVGGDA